MKLRLLRTLMALAVLGMSAIALGDNADPLGADQGLGLRSARQLAARIGERPCAEQLPDVPLSALDVIDLTLCRHPQTREVWANARSQAALVGAAQGAWLPRADGRMTSARVYNEGNDYGQRSIGVNFSWLLFDAGGRAASLESARALLDAANATRSSTVQGLMSAALQGYFAAQAAQAAVVASVEAERAAAEGAQAAEARYRIGVATPADQLQARTALSQATLNRVRAEGAARTAVGVLLNAMGFDAQSPVSLPPANEPGDVSVDLQEVDRLVGEARRRRPDLAAAEAQWRAARAGIEVAAAAGRPTLSLSATPAWQKVAGVGSEGGTLGLTLNIPLFYGFDTHYRTRSAEALAEAREAQRDKLSSQIALDVWRAYQTVQTSVQALQASRDLVDSATASERVALGRYKAGVGTILDLLNAQSALASARAQRIQTVFDWQVARTALAQAMGTLDYRAVQTGGVAEAGKP